MHSTWRKPESKCSKRARTCLAINPYGAWEVSEEIAPPPGWDGIPTWDVSVNESEERLFFRAVEKHYIHVVLRGDCEPGKRSKECVGRDDVETSRSGSPTDPKQELGEGRNSSRQGPGGEPEDRQANMLQHD